MKRILCFLFAAFFACGAHAAQTTTAANAPAYAGPADITSGTITGTNAIYTLYQTGVAASLPGDMVEAVLMTCSVPANVPGANGRVRVEFAGSNNNSAGTKTWRVRASGIGGTVLYVGQNTTVVAGSHRVTLANRGAANSQTGGTGSTNVSIGAHGALLAPSIDTTAAWTIVVTGQKNTGGDTQTLEHGSCEVLHGA